MKSDREYLLDAASVIEKRGHCKGRYQEFLGGPCCIMGAVFVATGPAYDLTGEVSLRLNRAVAAHLHLDMPCDVADWNDAPERTASEVIAALRETAESLNEQNGVGG